MDDTRLYPLVVVALMVACAGFGFMLGRQGATLPVQTRVEHKTDTLYVRDTITRETPVYLRSFARDTMLVKVTDTIVVELPREVRVYEDSLYYAEVSGYQPSLDYLELYQQDRVITRDVTQVVEVKKAARWGVGVQVGYGIGTHAGTVYTTPYVGVGLSWNILSW